MNTCLTWGYDLWLWYDLWGGVRMKFFYSCVCTLFPRFPMMLPKGVLNSTLFLKNPVSFAQSSPPSHLYGGKRGGTLLSHKNCYFGGVSQISVFLWLWWANQNDPLPTQKKRRKKERKKEEKTIKQTWVAAHVMKRREVNSKQQMNLA